MQQVLHEMHLLFVLGLNIACNIICYMHETFLITESKIINNYSLFVFDIKACELFRKSYYRINTQLLNRLYKMLKFC